jgi:hypothetical protein
VKWAKPLVPRRQFLPIGPVWLRTVGCQPGGASKVQGGEALAGLMDLIMGCDINALHCNLQNA